LKIEEEIWSASERYSELDLKEETIGSVRVHHLKDLSFVLVSSKGCKLQRRDFVLHSNRFNALTFSLLALHRCHHRETMLDKTQWHEDRVSIVDRMDILPRSVHGGS
jgi:hypothetical protein